MKKIFGLLSILLVCIILVGCGGNNTNSQLKLTTQKISSSVDKIIAQVKKMDDIKDSDIDLSSDLGYYSYDDYASYTDRYNNDANFSTPTRNNGIRHVNRYPSYASGQKRFNFVSKEAEESYGDLYSVSYDCTRLNEDYKTSKENLINNCMQLKNLLQRLNDSKINVSEADLKTLNSYYEVINSCHDNLCKSSSCQSCVKTINGKKANLAGNASSMMADYIRLCNSLDQSCLSCENASASVVELSRYLTNLLGETNADMTYNSRYNRDYRYSRNYNSYREYQTPRDNYYNNNDRDYRNYPPYENYNRDNFYPKTSENDTPYNTQIKKNEITPLPENEDNKKDENSYVFNDTNKDKNFDDKQNDDANNQNNKDNIRPNIEQNDMPKVPEIDKEKINNNDNRSRTHIRNGKVLRRHDIHNIDSKQNNNDKSENVDNTQDTIRRVRNINDKHTPRPMPDTYKKYMKNHTNSESKINSLNFGPKNVRA